MLVSSLIIVQHRPFCLQMLSRLASSRIQVSSLVGVRIHGVADATLFLDFAVQLLVPWVVRGVSPMQRSLRGWK